MGKYGLLAAAAAALAALLTPQITRLAVMVGSVDEPDERRVHHGPIPNLGGLAVLAAFLGALAVGLGTNEFVRSAFAEHSVWVWLLSGALIVTACGVADDVRKLSPAAKLVCQLAAGLTVLAAGYEISAVTDPFTGRSLALGWLGVPLTLLWVVGITNAFNLIDGLDGLAAGVALIACGTLFIVSLASGRVDVALLVAALGGALAGFLYYNFHPASVFLGDSGSLLIGYVLSVLSLRASLKGATTVVILIPILSLGLPIMDTLLAMLRRLLGGLHVVRLDGERNEYRFLFLGSTSIFRADREHIHHRLLQMGLTHRRAVLVLYGVCAVLSLLAFLAVRAKGGDGAILIAAVAVASYLGVRKLAYREVEVLRRGTLLPLFELPVLNQRAVHALMDAAFVALAYASSVLLVGGPQLAPHTRLHLLNSLLLIVAVKLATFVYAGLYERAYRHTNFRDLMALARALLGAQVASLAILAAVLGLPDRPVLIVLLDFYLTATLVIGARLSFRLLEALVQRNHAVRSRPVLIYGAGRSGTWLLSEIDQNLDLGYRAVGFIDDLPGLLNRKVNEVPVLGGVSDLTRILAQTGVRDVILASRKIGPERIREAAEACRRGGAELRRFTMSLDEVETRPGRDEGREIRRAVGS